MPYLPIPCHILQSGKTRYFDHPCVTPSYVCATSFIEVGQGHWYGGPPQRSSVPLGALGFLPFEDKDHDGKDIHRRRSRHHGVADPGAPGQPRRRRGRQPATSRIQAVAPSARRSITTHGSTSSKEAMASRQSFKLRKRLIGSQLCFHIRVE